MQIMIIVNDDDLIERNIFIKYNSKKLHSKVSISNKPSSRTLLVQSWVSTETPEHKLSSTTSINTFP